MNLFDPSILLMLEAAAPFLILSIVLALVILSGKKKMKNAAKNLILEVKANDKRERDSINDFLTNKLNIDEKTTKTTVKKITNERKFLLRNIISGILDKNIEAISNLNEDLSRVCRQYHQLEIDIKKDEPEKVAEEAIEEIAVESQGGNEKVLKKEIKNLKQEVHITLTTLNNIFREFSSMFGEDVPTSDMSVDQIITAMENFSGKEGAKPISDNDQEIRSSEAIKEESDSNFEVADNLAEVSEPTEEELSSNEEKNDGEVAIELPEEASISEQLDSIMGDEDDNDNLSVTTEEEIDDIDDALNMLELDSTDNEGEPDWGDAFAESGDVMEEEKG